MGSVCPDPPIHPLGDDSRYFGWYYLHVAVGIQVGATAQIVSVELVANFTSFCEMQFQIQLFSDRFRDYHQ